MRLCADRWPVGAPASLCCSSRRGATPHRRPAAWALGLGGLSLYLAPDVSRPLLVAGAVAGLVATVVGAWLLTRYPYVLAFATLACLPVRLPITIGSEKASLLLPLYAVVTMLALSLAWQLLRGDTRARSPRAPGCGRLLDGLARLTLDEEGLDLPRRLHPPVRCCVGAWLPWRGRWLTWLWAHSSDRAGYAAVGMYQWVTRDVFWNGIIVGTPTPAFGQPGLWDPSIHCATPRSHSRHPAGIVSAAFVAAQRGLYVVVVAI
jgi:hypothetical protein